MGGVQKHRVAAVHEALDDGTPEAEDPDAGHDGEPFVEGGHDEEWEDWCNWDDY